jgi:hypothetical protein
MAADEEIQIKRGDEELVLIDYHCECTWIGKRGERIESCVKHHEGLRTIIKLPDNTKLSQGWSCVEEKP